jgi:hypothetical protein
LFVVETTTYIDIVSQTEKTQKETREGRKAWIQMSGKTILLWVQKEDSEPLMTTEVEAQ